MMRQYDPRRQSCRRAVLLILLTSFFSWSFVLSGLGQRMPEQITRPQAIAEGSAEEVPLSLALKIVIDEASARWARFAVGSPVLCSDDNGKLVAYMVPVRLNNDVFPKDRELILSHGQNSEKMTFDWGAADYYTFVVSARERDFPIPCEFNTLPPFFVTATKAQEIAQQELQADEVSLAKYYFLGHRGEYFEFAGAGNSVLIDAYRLKVVDSSRTLYRKGPTAQALPESLSAEARLAGDTYRQQVRDEWKRLKERAALNGGARQSSLIPPRALA